MSRSRFLRLIAAFAVLATTVPAAALAADPPLPIVKVEGQPLAAAVSRLVDALEFLGKPLPGEVRERLAEACEKRDADEIQRILDPHVLVLVEINPESRVKARRGPGDATLQQAGYTPVIVKVLNEADVTAPLQVTSPQSGPVYSGGFFQKVEKTSGRFLDVEMFTAPPMTRQLSGLDVEYAIALIYSSEEGRREATLAFDVGQGTQDLGFRAEAPILFSVKPARLVRMNIKDYDGQPTVAHLMFEDELGHVYPPQAKRLAPDFFFQKQIYRPDGGEVLLPPGEFKMTYGRGPEYRVRSQKVTIPESGDVELEVRLERWVEPAKFGYFSGDHHIHAAGCAHYTSPTEGVFAEDMFLHVKGEGLNVGCNLTWGPCYDFQRQFFEAEAHKVSEPFTVLKYDVEVSGFGSQALGHVCLLNLKDQTYPGSDGTKEKGWPTWTTPLMRWAKSQGAYCGYAHSGSGLGVNPKAAAERLINQADDNGDKKISVAEAEGHLLPAPFEKIDLNGDKLLGPFELASTIERVRTDLPNLAIPQMDGIGAQEICVTTAQGLCDFISAMDTDRVPEWNCWYHILNCGFPLRVSGETDFPCISGSRVGQGRVYVHLGDIDRIDFAEWCAGVAAGRSYVSDGYAHPLVFTVNGEPSGGKVKLGEPGKVQVKAKVTFAKEMPLGTARGGQAPEEPDRLVELVMNGKVVASQKVPADDQMHDLSFEVPVERSSWIALRHFPQMHTNVVEVIVDDKPIRASRSSALWCIDVIEQLWRMRANVIAEHERDEADRTFKKAIEDYRKIASEAPENT